MTKGQSMKKILSIAISAVLLGIINTASADSASDAAQLQQQLDNTNETLATTEKNTETLKVQFNKQQRKANLLQAQLDKKERLLALLQQALDNKAAAIDMAEESTAFDDELGVELEFADPLEPSAPALAATESAALDDEVELLEIELTDE